MLQKKAVAPELLELLERLQRDPLTDRMLLVGGTALALQISYRKSTDLDLFSFERFDTYQASEHLIQDYGFEPRTLTKGALIGFIGGIKVDLINHPYRWLAPSVIDGPFRLASITDIAAMKMHAIANSGQRPKDFLDIAFLSRYFSYNQIKSFALQKYPNYDPIIMDKSIIYFKDIDRTSIEDIKMIGYKMDWDSVEERIFKMTDNPDKVFRYAPLKRIQPHTP